MRFRQAIIYAYNFSPFKKFCVDLNKIIAFKKKYNIEDKYLCFIEEVFVEDIIKLFRLNLYTQEIDENEIRNDIKFQMRHNSVMSYCKEMLHKSFRTVLMDFYKL